MKFSPGLRIEENLPQRSTILTVPVSTVVQQHDIVATRVRRENGADGPRLQCV